MITNSFKDLLKINTSLSIQLGLNGFSFFISSQQLSSDALTHKLAERSTEKEVIEALSNFILKNEILQQNFAKVTITYTDYIFTLIPKELFQEKRKEDYLKYNVQPLPSDIILHEEVEDTTITFAIPDLLKEKLEEYYHIDAYNHLSTTLLRYLLKEYRQNIGPRIFVYTYQDFFYLFVLNGSELLFCNTFPYKSDGDFLYYLLFTLEQLNLDPAKETLHLLNHIDNETLASIEPFIYDIKVPTKAFKNLVHLSNLQA